MCRLIYGHIKTDMCLSIKLLVLTFLITFSPIRLNAQWVPTASPGGGPALSVAVVDTIILVGTTSGVYRSTNYGLDWTKASEGLPSGSVAPIFAHGGYVFAHDPMSSCVSMFRSSDIGANWEPISNFLSDTICTGVDGFASGGTTLFGAASIDGVFRSTNNGSSWQAANSGLEGEDIRVLTVSGNDLFAGAYAGGGVFVSSDNGNSWRAVHNGFPKSLFDTTTYASIMSIAANGADLFVGTEYNGIVHSSDKGENWFTFSLGAKILTFTFTETSIYAGTLGGGVYRSTDNGISWNQANNGLGNLWVFSLVSLHNYLFAGTYLGMFRSEDGGMHWVEMNSGFASGAIKSLAVDGSNLYAGMEFTGVSVSSNSGETWKKTGLTNTTVEALLVKGSSLYAGTWNGVYSTADYGANWNHEGGFTNEWIFGLGKNGSKLYAGTNTNGVYVNTGFEWVPMNGGLPANSWVQAFAAVGTNMFCGIYGGSGGVYVMNDSTTKWTPVDTTGLTNPNILSMASIGNDIIAGTTMGTFYSTNGGSTWSRPKGIGPIGLIRALFSNGNNLFASSEGGGVYLSTDHGITWIAASDGLQNQYVYSFATGNGYLFVGTLGGIGHQGIWRRPLAQMITYAPVSTDQVPHDFSLTQNYPNPFNPSTSISYQLPTQSHVTLKIFDVLGREVATLVNRVEEPGYKTINFNANRLASSVYYYRIQAGNYIETKKLLLIR